MLSLTYFIHCLCFFFQGKFIVVIKTIDSSDKRNFFAGFELQSSHDFETRTKLESSIYKMRLDPNIEFGWINDVWIDPPDTRELSLWFGGFVKIL